MVIIKLGIVVQSIALICSKISEPAIAGARFVVSERGESLSPIYAPEIIAPAVICGGIPSPAPIPIRAIPIVAAVLQEFPVVSATIKDKISAAGKNIPGDIIFKP